MHDQDGMRAIGAAVAALAGDIQEKNVVAPPAVVS
jgi:hypothetical protein